MRYYASDKPWGDILPRYAFLGTLFEGLGILEIGCGDGSGAMFLKERGADHVVGVDLPGPDLDAALELEPLEGISFKALEAGRIDAPSAAFDVVIDFELGAEQQAGEFEEVIRLLKPTGILVTGIRNPEHPNLSDLVGLEAPPARLSFEDFIARLQESFARVTVLGQTPLLGCTVGWMGAGAEDAPLVMDSLDDGDQEEVAYYIVVCGRENLKLDEQLLIQLPYRRVIEEISGELVEVSEEEETGEDIRHSSEELEDLQQKLIELRRENAQLARATEDLQDQLAAREGETQHVRSEARELRHLVRRREEEVSEKLSWLEGARIEVERLQGELADQHKLADDFRKRITELESEMRLRSVTRGDDEVAVTMLRQENLGLKISQRKLGQEISALRKERDDRQAELDDLRNSVLERKQQVDQARDEVQNLRQECERLERFAEEARNGRATTEEQLGVLRSENEKLLGDLSALEGEKERLDLSLGDSRRREDAARAGRQTIEEVLNDSRKEAQNLRSLLAEKTGALAGAERDLADQRTRQHELESDMVALINRIEDGESRDYDRRMMIDELSERSSQKQQDLEDAQEKIAELTRELYTARRHEEDLARQIESQRTEALDQERAREGLEAEISNLRVGERDELQRMLGEVRTAESRVALLEREKDALSDELEREREFAQKARSDFIRQGSQIEVLRGNLAVAEGRLREELQHGAKLPALEQDLAWHQEEVSRLTAEIQAMGDELEHYRWDLDQVHEELVEAREIAEKAENEVSKLRSAGLEEECQKLKHELAKQRELYDELELGERDNQSLIEKLSGQLNDRDRELEQTRQDLDRERAHGKLLIEKLDRLDLELRESAGPTAEELRLALEREQTLQARAATLQEQLGELKEKTGSDLSALGEQLRRREEQMRSLTSRLAEMDEKVLAGEDRSQSLQLELEKVKAREKQFGELAAGLAEMEERALAAEMRCAELERRLSTPRDDD